MDARRIDDIDWTQWRAKDLATLVFHLRGDDILLIRKKRGLGAGKINGPGGKLDPGETPLACATREVEEELRITPLDPLELGVLRFQFLDGYSIQAHVFRADAFEGTPTETDEALPLWFRTDAIPYDEMWADDELWLPHLIEGKPFDGSFLFDDDEMLDYALDLEDA